MRIDASAAATPGLLGPRAKSPEEAAAQFEQVLIKQFVQNMTKDLFKSSLAGEAGPGWMEGQADLQRDALNDALTEQLARRGTLRFADLLTRQWAQRGELPPDSASEPTP